MLEQYISNINALNVSSVTRSSSGAQETVCAARCRIQLSLILSFCLSRAVYVQGCVGPGLVCDVCPGLVCDGCPGLVCDVCPGLVCDGCPGLVFDGCPGLVCDGCPGLVCDGCPLGSVHCQLRRHSLFSQC